MGQMAGYGGYGGPCGVAGVAGAGYGPVGCGAGLWTTTGVILVLYILLVIVSRGFII